MILEPQAVGDICQLIGFYADARATDEGRSPFVKQGGGTKIGEKIMDERVSIFADPFDPQVLAQPFDGDGLAAGPAGLHREWRAQDAVLLALLGAEEGRAARRARQRRS